MKDLAMTIGIIVFGIALVVLAMQAGVADLFDR